MFTSIRVKLKYKRLNVINRFWDISNTITKSTYIYFPTPAVSQGCKTYCEKPTKTQ